MPENSNILLVDDDADAAQSLARALKIKLPKFAFQVATSEQMALKLAAQYKPQVIVQDLSLNERAGPKSGFDLLIELQSIDSSVRVIVLTGLGSLEHGVKALQRGAASFLEKPADVSHLAVLIEDCAKQTELRRELLRLMQSSSSISQSILGESDAIKHVRQTVEHAAQTSQAVLITGETGTGKGLIARSIHGLSRRALKNFVRYQPNFGTADLVASELFGHIKGSFTGADRDRRGLIVDADNGTLFLDEIDELPIATQITLLNVIQEKRFRAVGSNQECSADFRLISATNRKIEEAINTGKIRADLFHRIGHFKIHIPALRERKNDIKPLANATLARLRDRERVNVFDIDEQAFKILQSYAWPGNVRELEAVIESAAYRAEIYSRSAIIEDDISIRSNSLCSSAKSFNEHVAKFKNELISAALEKHNGNQFRAAKELGIDRATVKRAIERQI